MHTSHPAAKAPLSAPGGGEGRGEVGEIVSSDTAHLTLSSLRDGPLPLPPQAGGEGPRPATRNVQANMCACPSACGGGLGWGLSSLALLAVVQLCTMRSNLSGRSFAAQLANHAALTSSGFNGSSMMIMSAPR